MNNARQNWHLVTEAEDRRYRGEAVNAIKSLELLERVRESYNR